MGSISQFKQNDKVTVSHSCKDKQYRGVSGTVIDTYPWGDGLTNKVCTDKPIDNKCVFWFADHELMRQA